jgi:hypothetical protein
MFTSRAFPSLNASTIFSTTLNLLHSQHGYEKPLCGDALQELGSNGISYLDLDLVLGVDPEERSNEKDAEHLFVSHPMEYTQTSSYYSPCALTPLSDLIGLLDANMGYRQWFFTLEPKASWGGTAKERADPALAEPAAILQALLKIVQTHRLTPKQCGIIVPPPDPKTNLRELFVAFSPHCDLVFPVRRNDVAPTSIEMELNGYNYLMPTVELHPDHPHYPGRKTPPIFMEALSILWIVDTWQDLELVATFARRTQVTLSGGCVGIVSNYPKKIVALLNDDSWCSEPAAV